jgi:hypothetical protein
MGFTSGSAVTANSDFTKFAFEQSLTKILASGNTFSDLHVGVVDELIARLRAERGVDDPSVISNTADWKPYLVHRVLAKIFAGITPRGGDNGKAAYYEAKSEELWRRTAVRTATTTQARRGLPVIAQPEAGTRFPAPGVAPGWSLVGEVPDFTSRALGGY